MADKINIVVVKDDADRYLGKVANKIQRNAKQIAPVLTGALRDSISVKRDTSSGYGVGYSIGSDLDYSLFVELGTKNMGLTFFKTVT